MRILDRYIVSRYVKGIILGVVIFLLLYIIVDLFSHLDDILQNKVPLMILAKYYLSMVPMIFVNVVPVSSLLSGMYSMSNMNYANEIIAIRSSGKGLGFILFPLVATALLLSGVVFFVNEKFVPGSVVFTKSVKRDFIMRGYAEKEHVALRNLAFYGEDNKLFFVSRFFPDRKEMQGIVILFQDESQKVRKKWVAQKAVWRDGKWRFENLLVYEFSETGEIEQEKRQFFIEKEVDLGQTPQDIVRNEVYSDSLNIKALLSHIDRLKQSKAEATLRDYQVELLSRIIFPFSSVILLIAGLPFTLRIGRKPVGVAQIGLGIMLFFLYYVGIMFSVGIAKLANAPIWAVLLPVPLIFLVFGLGALSLLP